MDMNSIDWSLAPEGATHATLEADGPRFFKQDHEAYGWWKGEWRSLGPRLEWCFFTKDAIARPSPQNSDQQNVARHEWYEGDIPPVGLSFEFTSNGGHNWNARTILYKDDSVILLDGHQLFKLADPDIGFRPARTPEQVEADEREKARDDALNTMTGEGWTTGETEEQWQFRLKIVSEMLDMGYRKP
jgi:hypothetical protein